MRLYFNYNELNILKNLDMFIHVNCKRCPCYNTTCNETCHVENIINKVKLADKEQREIYLYQMEIDGESQYALVEPATNFIHYYNKDEYESLKEKLFYLFENKKAKLIDVEKRNDVSETAYLNNQLIEERFELEYNDITNLHGTMILRMEDLNEIQNKNEWNETSIKLLIRKDQWNKFNFN